MGKELVSIQHADAAIGRTVVINWCLGTICNYACSYCPENLHDGAKKFPPLDVVQSFCQKVIDHYTNSGRRLYFEFTGGEVSHYKEFLALIQFLKERGALTGMISNGSKAMAWWQTAKPFLDHVCLSFHPEFGKADHFKEVVQFMRDTATVHVNIMMLPERFDELMKMAEWIEAETENVSIAIQPLLYDFSEKMYPYTAEQKALLENKKFNIKYNKELNLYRGLMEKVFSDGTTEKVEAPQLIARGENNWAGWKCWAGLDELVINSDGEVYRAWCSEGGKLGSVTDKNFYFPRNPVLCRRNHCHCVLDVMNHREKELIHATNLSAQQFN